MNIEVYNTLNEILNELRQKKIRIDEKLRHISNCLKEVEVHSEAFKNKESDDVRVFSPRNAEMINKDEIEKLRIQKSHYEEENQYYIQKNEKIISRIERIERILKSENDSLTVLSIQEEDRKRIARDLHDTSLQNLAHLIHQIELSGLYIDEDPIRAKLELSVVNKRLREIIDEIRNTIFDLRPMTFDDLGLKAVFERLIDSINEDKKYEVDLNIENVSCETNIVLVTIYRVVQECLNNIVKHAEASKISLSCKCKNNDCHIVIRDNGKGFVDETNDYGEKHFGIFCMKERIKLLGGKIDFDSVPEEGTTISIMIPLDAYNV